MKFLRSLLDAKDTSADSVVMIGLSSAFMLFCFQAYALYKGQAFDAQGFGIGVGGVTAAMGIAKALRDGKGEPV